MSADGAKTGLEKSGRNRYNRMHRGFFSFIRDGEQGCLTGAKEAGAHVLLTTAGMAGGSFSSSVLRGDC